MVDEKTIKTQSLRQCLAAFKGAGDGSETDKIARLDREFFLLAQKMLYGGYLKVGDDYEIYITGKSKRDNIDIAKSYIVTGDNEVSYEKYGVSAKAMIESAKRHISILEKYDFHDIVISLKASNIRETINAYELASELFPYPLHIGITEAGPYDLSVIRSTAGLAPLLLEGIGDTIRISITGDAQSEVIAAKRLLHDCGLYENYPTFISCPTCGRTQVDVKPLGAKVFKYLEDNNIKLTVAVMGCAVNGPGEAKEADIGIAGGLHEGLLIKKGEIVKKLPEDELLPALKYELDHWNQ